MNKCMVPLKWSALALLLGLMSGATNVRGDEPAFRVGACAVDVTPHYPIRLSGFGFRRAESEGVTQPIWAKGLAIEPKEEAPLVVVAVDNCGIPLAMIEEVAKRLAKSHNLPRERFAVTATHTHTAPMVGTILPTLFGGPIPAEHQDRINRYTRELTDMIEAAAVRALEARTPAELAFATGKVDFAKNRRTAGGPVNHDLPVLVARAPDGKIIAIYTTYACHCVTLSNNKISGDWAGFAQDQIQRRHAGAISLVSVGCGADQNPTSGVTGDKVDVAADQGSLIAREVDRLLAGPLTPIRGPSKAQFDRFDLPLDTLPTQAKWQELAQRSDAVGYHAKVQLDRLGRGEKLRDRIAYSVQTWQLGEALAMVFLPGEVVVDYSLRLKREHDRKRLWINAYANDCPCYIPSERILKEGGYEGGDAMVYYDVPTRLAPGLENVIVGKVKQQLGDRFARAGNARTEGTSPRSPAESLASIRVPKGLRVELVAAEPLVIDPVAIDFGPEGRLWVAEMHDYPEGLDGNYSPAGRIVALEDVDGDGRYDRRTVFLDKVPFPTGVTVWRDGVMVCAAPDVLFARDTNGDGKADETKKLLTGFATHNYQARVNSLCYGLDGWVYAASGIFGGKIKSFSGAEVDLNSRDFRFKPDTGEIEPVAGQTQQGRVRDDWGNWFGCDNSTLLRHFPLIDHYLRRNPNSVPPATIVYVPDYPESNLLHPISKPLERFNDPGHLNRVTSACGLGIYRDVLLGEQYEGNAFVCEPVHNLVHRIEMTPKGVTFRGGRPKSEQQSEFLASTDNWFRPVQIRTGPDGALWVVDMYRFLIEHPRWVAPERLATLDRRAGDNQGRIYRVVPSDLPLRKAPKLSKLNSNALAGALRIPNGTLREMASQVFQWRGELTATDQLKKLAISGGLPQTRIDAAATLAELGAIDAATVMRLLDDKDEHVRRHAVRLAEPLLQRDAALAIKVAGRAHDDSIAVRYQLAQSIGVWDNPRTADVLAAIALRDSGDPYMQAAVHSSLNARNIGGALTQVLKSSANERAREPVAASLFALAADLGDDAALAQALELAVDEKTALPPQSRRKVIVGILDSLQRRKIALGSVARGPLAKSLESVFAEARMQASDEAAAETDRVVAIRLLARTNSRRHDDIRLLSSLLVPQISSAIQEAAASRLGEIDDPTVPAALLQGWASHSPRMRSAILDSLLARSAWTRNLLDAIDQKTVLVAHVDAARRDRLLRLADSSLRQRAEKLFAGGAASRDRAAVVEQYAKTVADHAVSANGKEVFKKHCSACHKLEGIGHEVGPNLAALTRKTSQSLLVEVLDPNRAVDSRFLGYIAVLNDGRSLTGLLTNETSTSITLRGQEGKEEVLLRRDIEQLAGTGMSLMPEGLEKDITPAEMADVLAYIAGFGPKPKQFVGNRPAVVQPAGNGTITLAAASAEIYGNDIAFESEFKNIGMWHAESDHVAWTVDVPASGRYRVELDWACHNTVAGNRYRIEGGADPLEGRVEGTGGWDQYQRSNIGELTLDAGRCSMIVRPVGRVQGALLDLRTIRLVPAALAVVAADEKPAPKNVAVSETPAAIGKKLLDDSTPNAERGELILKHSKMSAELIAAMAAGLPADQKEEYRRIPWIWRVAVSAGRRNDLAELRRVVEISLPAVDQPLLDWQAVVIGGGVINGVSEKGEWPDLKMREIVKGNESMTKRWEHVLEAARQMSDNKKVPDGTRYDALRILGADTWERRGAQLKKYLGSANAELQMGAVSGAADIRDERAATSLIAAYAGLTPQNRKLAVAGLVRDEDRARLLIDAIERNTIPATDIDEAAKKKLAEVKDDGLRAKVNKILAK